MSMKPHKLKIQGYQRTPLIAILLTSVIVRALGLLLNYQVDALYFPQYLLIISVSLIGLILVVKQKVDTALLSLIAIALIEFFLGIDKLLSLIYWLKGYPITDCFYSFTIFAASVFIALPSRQTLSNDTIVSSEILSESDREHPYAVELVDVIKDYVVGPYVVHALRGVTMKVRKGEFVAIMGPSGSGKSTLLNMIGAIDRPTAGKVLVDGIDISKLNDNQLAELRNKKIGFVFQAYNLINRTTVLRNVELPAIVSGMPRSERIKRAKELLALVGLKDEIHRSPKYLSGGQQQRVAIARALMNNPSLILADEPTGNLDSKSGKEVMLYLRKLNEELGTTVIVVTHDRSVAEMADRILYIRDGKIVGEEVLRNGERYGKEE